MGRVRILSTGGIIEYELHGEPPTVQEVRCAIVLRLCETFIQIRVCTGANTLKDWYELKGLDEVEFLEDDGPEEEEFRNALLLQTWDDLKISDTLKVHGRLLNTLPMCLAECASLKTIFQCGLYN